MKKCPQCDKRYDDSQKFCSDCGVELTDLSWDEQNQLIAEEQKAKTKKTGIIAVACVLALVIAIGFFTMFYPILQAKQAVSAVAEERGSNYAIAYVTECDIFECPYGKFVVVDLGYLDKYFVRVEGLEVKSVYDYNIYRTSDAGLFLNEYYLDIYEEYIDLIGTGKIKTVKV